MSVQPTSSLSADPHSPRHPLRFVTATSLFDGHDAAINLIRRLLQRAGAEVVHLGHDRSVSEIVDAAIQEDAQGIAVSSYQGGHIEFFSYLIDLLRERGASHVQVFGGGGGVIVPREIAQLEAYGVAKIFSPEDGRKLGLQGMIGQMVSRCDFSPLDIAPADLSSERLTVRHPAAVARAITAVEMGAPGLLALPRRPGPPAPVVGITGTGGAGKSSVTDELLLRFLSDFPERSVAVLAIDPTRRRSGGALLGDRIRMNALDNPRAYMRSLATRQSGAPISSALPAAIDVLQAAGYDLILVETSGIGQGDSAIVDLVDLSVYVMTAEYGASTQLEKIDMLDLADRVVLNKFDKPGSLDAMRAVRKQVRRNHFERYGAETPDEGLPVFGTVASRFADPGTTALYLSLLDGLRETWPDLTTTRYVRPPSPATSVDRPLIPAARTRYLAEIADTCRTYRKQVESQSDIAHRAQVATEAAQLVAGDTSATLERRAALELEQLTPESRALLRGWSQVVASYDADEMPFEVRGKTFTEPLLALTLSGTRVPRIALPSYRNWGDQLRWQLLENVPGKFPFTAGVFPFKRRNEEPKRQFAGEGPPERTNKRFHYLSAQESAKRLSTAFDSVTLYGRDPDPRPDIYGKVGESGVSVCTLDNMRALYAGFDLCHPSTSVSMTINGPAPILLAMFLNVAIDQQVEQFRGLKDREPTSEERAQIAAYTLSTVRGTVQADILKEDQAQNTCIFNTEFALRMMGDIQAYFIEKEVRNYYSVSVSGYHIAEAGANPISQLAFTLANGFTYVEYYLARAMAVDDFAPNLSFFFSNGLDAEYAVLGRVARRIWSVALRERYGANERSQKLKYHVQTSGRSLHAQEIDFNDIRTTLQALLALNDHCNSLHTNAFDEAVTTPTEASVRRAMAIQLIITRELGLSLNENPNQGAFILEALTDRVEAAVLREFDEIASRGGVLGAMEREYQRNKIQEESLLYERKKHSGELPLIGVNTFVRQEGSSVEAQLDALELTRATPEEKHSQLDKLRAFQERHADECASALHRLQQVAMAGGNVFAELMSTVRVASLGQITQALFEVGGRYRRNM